MVFGKWEEWIELGDRLYYKQDGDGNIRSVKCLRLGNHQRL